MATKLALLFVAGGLGTLARYGLTAWIHARHSHAFPWGTFAVNAAGCFLYGAIWALFDRPRLISDEQRLYVLVGFLGGFTTFSSFAFETQRLLELERPWLALANMAGQNACGLLLAFAGVALGRKL